MGIFHGDNPQISIRFSKEPETLKENKIAKQHSVIGKMVSLFIETHMLNYITIQQCQILAVVLLDTIFNFLVKYNCFYFIISDGLIMVSVQSAGSLKYQSTKIEQKSFLEVFKALIFKHFTSSFSKTISLIYKKDRIKQIFCT